LNLDLLDASIKTHEGKRNTPYVDSKGNLTIGYGHNLKEGLDDPSIDFIYVQDRNFAITTAQGESWWNAVSGFDARARAMVEMVFNMGVSGVRTFRNATSLLCAGDFNGAADAFLDSEWAREVGDRATVLAGMIRTDADPSSTTSTT